MLALKDGGVCKVVRPLSPSTHPYQVHLQLRFKTETHRHVRGLGCPFKHYHVCYLYFHCFGTPCTISGKSKEIPREIAP